MFKIWSVTAILALILASSAWEIGAQKTHAPDKDPVTGHIVVQS